MSEELKEKSAEEFRKELCNDFYVFVKTVFAASFDSFQDGEYIKQVCDFLQHNKKTVRIGPKDHFKSMSLYAFLAWQIWKARYEGGFGAYYFSYDKSQSFYHLNKLKAMIKSNPFFKDLIDFKSTAEGILKFGWNDSKEFCTIKPKSLQGFKRGIHEKIILVDDPFQDPANRFDPVIVRKINEIFKSQIMDMPYQDGYLHVVMTPQTKDDFCLDQNLMGRFKVLSQPAISSDAFGKKKALWPEHMSLEEIEIRRKERGEKTFMREYMCQPSFEADAFWPYVKVEPMLGNLAPLTELKTENIVCAGWDIGKHRHPAHISIFEKVEGVWYQRYQKFMDGWDYSEQVEHANELIQRFSVDYAYFDNTSREVESFREQGILKRPWQPVIFKTETKWKMANNMERLRTEKKLFFIRNDRQTNQLQVVNNSLKALETVEGHGEPFFTAGLALLAELEVKRVPLKGSIVIMRPKVSLVNTRHLRDRLVTHRLRDKYAR